MCSFLAGVLCFVFLSVPYFLTRVVVDGEPTTKTENAWQMLKNYDGAVNGCIMFKVATIVMIVLASILIVWSILLLLRNFDILKTDMVNLNLMNTFVLFLLVVATLIQMIAILMMSNFVGVAIEGVIGAYTGVGLWLNIATSMIAFVSALMFTQSLRLLDNE